jgi:hypothetical protein
VRTRRIRAHGRAQRPAPAPQTNKTVGRAAENYPSPWFISRRCVPLPAQAGNVTERLGRGLQNLLRRFESARYLKTPSKPGAYWGFPFRYFLG